MDQKHRRNHPMEDCVIEGCGATSVSPKHYGVVHGVRVTDHLGPSQRYTPSNPAYRCKRCRERIDGSSHKAMKHLIERHPDLLPEAGSVARESAANESQTESVLEGNDHQGWIPVSLEQLLDVGATQRVLERLLGRISALEEGRDSLQGQLGIMDGLLKSLSDEKAQLDRSLARLAKERRDEIMKRAHLQVSEAVVASLEYNQRQ